MFYENPNISYKHEGWFSKLFPNLDISLFICKKLPYTFDLVHSIDTRVVYGAGCPPGPPARLISPIDLCARPIRVKWALIDRPW
jgi:hypothetical protein